MTKSKKIHDPFYDREKANYSNPIPSREFILQYLEERGQPATRAELIIELGLTHEEAIEALRRRLRAMERDGQLVFNRRGGYCIAKKMALVSGYVTGHKDGYGFLIPDDGSEDLYLSSRQMRIVLDGDHVLARINEYGKRGKKEGEVVDVLERGKKNLAGRFFIEKNVGFVRPDNKRINQDIIIPEGKANGAVNGQYVLIEITHYPTWRTQAIGQVTQVLGDHLAPGMEINVSVHNFGLPYQWPESVKEELETFSTQVTVPSDRKDLRDKAFVTIDGEDAKDFDDAVYCEPKARGGWKLYVAIADVSFYVKPKTALDNEATLRGNSVYFPARVIPMLPEILSNDLCSLRPNRDRLALVCEMNISSKGHLSNYVFYEAVFQSQARLTYSKVYAMLAENHQKYRTQYKDLLPHLEQLYALFKVLTERRELRGALDFDTIETSVIFDENRKIKQIVPRQRNDAHRLIEECMLLANVSAAKFLAEYDIPALFRVHAPPNPDKLADLRKFLSSFGLSLKGGKNPKPKDYADIIEIIADRPDKHLIQTVLLRSMAQAVYTPDNKGHFGLAYDCYAHFTSPIRRYPDLLVHRAIKHLIANRTADGFLYDKNEMQKLGEHCSMTERRADGATRDVIDWLKCEYMQQRVGETFEGIISSVTAFGLFVELKDIYVEGLVHVTALKNDYYQFDPTKYQLRGERTHKIYRLGDPISVRVLKINLDNREIDLELAR